jgi:hypothetical protein
MRKKDKYIPTHLLTQEKKEERRKKCREDFKKHYEKMKTKSTSKLCTSKGIRETRSSTSSITVKCPFQQNKKGVAIKKRYSRALRKAYRDISELQSKCKKIAKRKEKSKEKAGKRKSPFSSLIFL